jgi:hypothetical protein
MALPRKRFDGKLQGKTVYSFSKGLDFNLGQSDRIKAVQDKIYTDDGKLDPYFVEYFDDYFRAELTSEDFLSGDINIFQELDKMANYILYSPDGERISKKTKYNFYTEDKLFKQSCKTVSLDGMVENASDNCNYDTNIYDEVLDFLIRKGDNYKKSVQQKIKAEDFTNPKLEIDKGNILKQYQDAIDSSKKKLDGLRATGGNFKLQKQVEGQLGGLKSDQYNCKDKILGTIYLKHVMADDGYIDYQMFSFEELEQVVALLALKPRDLTSDVGLLIYELGLILGQCKLSETDLNYLQEYRNIGDITDLASELGEDRRSIKSKIYNIAKKVVKKYKELKNDWVKLNIIKGEYKKCSSCDEIKLIEYFYIDKQNKDGLKNICKECLGN